MDNNIQYRISINPNDPAVKVSKIKNTRYRIEFTEESGKKIVYDAKATIDNVYNTLYFPIPKGNGKATLKKLRDHGVGEFVKIADAEIATETYVATTNNPTQQEETIMTIQNNTPAETVVPAPVSTAPVADTQPQPAPTQAAQTTMDAALAAKGIKLPLDPNNLTVNNYGYKEVPEKFANVDEVALFLLTAENMLMQDDAAFAVATGMPDKNNMTIALRRQGINIAYQQLAHPDIEGVGQPGHPNYRMLDGTCTRNGKPLTNAELEHYTTVVAPQIQAKQEQDMKDALAELRRQTSGSASDNEDWTDTAMRYGRYALTAAAIAGTGYLIYKGVTYLMGDDAPEA